MYKNRRLRFVEGVEGEQAIAPADMKPAEDTVDWKAEADKWKAHSRTWENRANENKEAKQRLDELEDQGRSELEKLQKQNAEIEAALAAERENFARAEAARVVAEVASEFGISKDDRELFLTGGDEETLRKQAEALSKRRGAENPNQGKGNTGGSQQSANSWAQQILGIQE